MLIFRKYRWGCVDVFCVVLYDLNIKIKFEGGEDLDDLIYKYVSKDLVRVCF